MSRICSIHQPSYWPYLGLFDKIARSDVFVFLDDVQYVKNEFKNRNRIFIQSARSAARERVDWLTLPVRVECLDQTIRGTAVLNLSGTMRKHRATLQQAYSSAQGFSAVWPEVEGALERLAANASSLAEINATVTRLGINWLGIGTEVYGMSSTIADKSSEPTQRLIDICHHVGADTYLAGAGAHNYMRVNEFARQGITVVWQDWHPFPYRQVHTAGQFVPYLSCLDLMFNEGDRAASYFVITSNV